jgi:hypothetical protein
MAKPAADKAVLIQVRTDSATSDELDSVRRAERDIPTRAEMIRRLIKRAFEKLRR